MLLSPASTSASLPSQSFWGRIENKKPDKESEFQKQAQMAPVRQCLLTLAYGDMENLRLLPQSFAELEAVARDWTDLPPDAIFSLRVPVEFASSGASRLVSGPYIYLTGEDSYQIAIHGVQSLRVEIGPSPPSTSASQPFRAKIENKKPDKESEYQEQENRAFARLRLLTLVYGDMETVRILPNSFPELMTVARDWTKPPPDAIFSLRVPIEFASSSTTRLVFGPYVYLTGEDSYQIAILGVQNPRVEVVSDAPPPLDKPPPPASTSASPRFRGRIKNEKPDKENEFQKQENQALARPRLLTFAYGDMETVRLFPQSFLELDAIARGWTKLPPDAIFSLRMPVEFASLGASRLVSGPYIYLTGEDSYQIATHGLQDLWVEIVSDAPPPPDEPPPRVQVRDRARSVTSSILDLPAVPEPVVPHQDGSSHHESEWSRGSSFDSILDLPAVLEPGKRRPRKKQAHRPAVRTPPVAATVAPAELAGGPVDSPRASKAAADEIRAGPSAQSATGAGPSTPRSHQGPLARLLAHFSVLFRTQTPRSPDTHEMQPTTSDGPPALRIPEMRPISRPLQRTPPIQIVDVSAGREMERMAVRTNNGEVGWLDYICFCVCCDRDDRPDSDSESES